MNDLALEPLPAIVGKLRVSLMPVLQSLAT